MCCEWSVAKINELAAVRCAGYKSGNLWRLGLPDGIKNWSLTSLQQRPMKTVGRVVKHARYYWLLLADRHLNRKLLGEMLGGELGATVPGG